MMVRIVPLCLRLVSSRKAVPIVVVGCAANPSEGLVLPRVSYFVGFVWSLVVPDIRPESASLSE